MKISIPVEVKSRDLTGVVWLALNLLEEERNIVIGETASIRNSIDVMEPEIYIRPGLSEVESKINLCRNIKEAGGKVLVIETEGGVFTSDEYFRDQVIHGKMLEWTDVYFSWGQKQAEILTKNTNTETTDVCVSGHPRFDLLHENTRGIYQEQADQYSSEYGDYILINTNFTAANRAVQNSTGYSSDRMKYEKTILREYTKTIKNLASDFEPHSIIVRPHPMEDVTYYRDKFSEFNNIYVLREGNVRPWMLGADVVIHKSSTSGIESALLDTPVISYRPAKSNEYDADLPILASDERTNYDELQNAIANYLENSNYSMDSNQIDGIKKYFHNIEGIHAADIITEKVETNLVEESVNLSHVNPPLKQKLKRVGVKYAGIDTTERIGELFLGSDFSNTRQKVPEITKEELRSEINRIRKHTNVEVNSPMVEEIPELPNTFTVSPD